MAVGVNNELKDDQPECIAGKLAIDNIFCNTEISFNCFFMGLHLCHPEVSVRFDYLSSVFSWSFVFCITNMKHSKRGYLPQEESCILFGLKMIITVNLPFASITINSMSFVTLMKLASLFSIFVMKFLDFLRLFVTNHNMRGIQ